MYYAGIGSRNLNSNELEICRALGFIMAQKGWTLRTGGAYGADKAFVEGALDAGGKVELFIPWPSYNFKWIEPIALENVEVHTLDPLDLAAFGSLDLHPAKDRLSKGARLLHARNYNVIVESSIVFAFPRINEYGSKGGTGHGIKIAKTLGIQVVDLSDKKELESLLEENKIEEHYTLDTGWGCGDIVVENGIVTDSIPIFKRLIGESLDKLKKVYKVIGG